MTSQKRKCTGTRKDGKPCTASAAPGTNPPRCWRHPVTKTPTVKKKVGPPAAAARAGAPKGNKNAEKHGAYSRSALPAQTDDVIANIAAAITDLQQKRKRLSRYIDDNQDTLAPLEYAKMLDLLGRLDSRIARLYKQLRELTGEGASTTETDVDAVLRVLSATYGIDLTAEKK